MRTLLILRGAMGAGKSHFVKENHLQPFTLSVDAIRQLMYPPEIKEDGTLTYNVYGHQEQKVWEYLFSQLEYRMKNGHFVVIDATHKDVDALNHYRKLCKQYRYSMFIYNINTPLEKCLANNELRPSYEYVNPEHIRNTHAKISGIKLPNWCKTINSLSEIENYFTEDFNQYRQVKVIGDIQGCFTVLKQAVGEMKDDTKYIFIGDYLDRGIENKQVFDFMLSIYEKPNVLLLEGNHEMHLNNFGLGKTIQNRLFITDTLPELLGVDKQMIKTALSKTNVKLNNDELLNFVLAESKVSQKEIHSLKEKCLNLYRRCNQASLFVFKGQKYFCNHGGLTSVPKLLYVPTKTLIHGFGKHNDTNTSELYKRNYEKGLCQNLIQVFGHRKSTSNEYSINLIDDINVEYGGNLPILVIDENGCNKQLFKNPVFTNEPAKTIKNLNLDNSVLNLFNNSKFIHLKDLKAHNLIAVNFNKNAFKKWHWDESTIKARGLFLDKDTGAVKMRSYDKFFDYRNEECAFPVKVYKKYNGFLGIASIINDELVLATKSTIYGTYKNYFSELFQQETVENRDLIIQLSKKFNCSFTFEVIHPKDPHIIDYQGKPQLYILDAIPNELHYNEKDLDSFSNQVLSMLDNLTFIQHKETMFVANNNQELKSFIYENVAIMQEEGVVIRDDSGKMYKIKSNFYKKWKVARTLFEVFKNTIHHRFPMSRCHNEFETNFVIWLSKQDKSWLLQDDMNIIKLRNEFIKT